MKIDPHTIDAALQNLSPEEKWKMLEIIQEIEQREFVKLCRNSLHQFVLAMQPDYKMGTHLKRLYSLLNDVEKGEKDRILVNMPPRFGKSVAISIMFPAWYLGKHPDHKLIIASHTADLAVDMLRKVRNLMQTEEYKRIFPGVDIASDAKAAGKWNTTKGGEAYAVGVGGALAGRGANLCLHLETKVRVKGRGLINAGLVQVGDFIWTHAGYFPVLARIDSTHEVTVAVNGALRVTKEHPIWVFGRGWVEAGKLNLGDVLWTTCLYDKVKAPLQGAIHAKNDPRQILHSDLQHMGYDAPALYQSKRSKLRKLWSQRYNRLRAMVDIFKLPSRYGRSPLSAAHAGSHRQCEGLFTGELPVGRCRNAAEQQAILRLLRARGPKVDRTTVGTQSGNYDRHVQTSSQRAWYEYCASLGSAKDVPCPEEGYPEVFGWFRNCCARFLSRSGQKHRPTRLRENKKRALGSFRSWADDLLGLLLGVRRVDHLTIEEHKPRAFVNFMVGGDNTFVADSLLTHNCIVDDPFSEQDVINGNYEVFDKVYEWYTYGLRTRLMPGGALAVLHTRWSLKDITSRLLKDGQLNPEADQYELFEFPAILNENEPNQKSLWPEQWSLEALLRTKASMPLFQWAAQYQQNPTNEAGGIVLKDWFKVWEKDSPPQVEFIVMSLDAAVEAKQRSDFNALTTWGVFNNEETRRYEVILLNSLNFRAEFPALKDRALQEYKYWEPDSFIIEAKANGAPLIQELRLMGIAVQSFVPHRGTGDKTMRLNAVADMIRDGLVWVPQTRWAEELVDQVATFPAADNDDLTDSTVLALMRVRQGGFVSLSSDEEYDDNVADRPRRAYY